MLEQVKNNIVFDANKIKYIKIDNFKSIDYKIYMNFIKNGFSLVLIINVDNFNDYDKVSYFLTEKEKIKRNKYLRIKDKKCFSIAHGLINYLYSNWNNCGMEYLSRGKGFYGKPFINNVDKINFNITHSMNVIGICITKHLVGIDIEYMDKGVDYKNIINSLFNENDRRVVAKESDIFFKYWVAKEAYIKLGGNSLNKLLKFLYVKRISNNVIEIFDTYNNIYKRIYIFEPEINYKGGLALQCIKTN
ncbi:4'-phosphopantetheinyl transferase family protein [Clostridium botulinum]|uniref:4'-phosphopantetheinyl transferase family protein n=1 Tax=Clostridium botulinum TaxID=1491 RepID=UPI0007737A7D|nr:4'-phosphopantetheinyl transferase superfamily protein [Clostridium botulinum]MBY6952134.1 4'-phosphopantetheinyl transferase superfamily protein [Clostridium botulinum]MCR1139760.1 4'-phosphopantetheinyl transferase superfamily protein [Clostridium botulinum]NEZ79202.1 4'-phosphopantetheinyl transferase superfamily protein [Clostridium botulinum]NFA17218.1 4'-phosphopantetheinyl transferase superfamily protein [Clostridium botulinum]NFA54851.1 4'-phosphopantetheinyl transferase superfamily